MTCPQNCDFVRMDSGTDEPAWCGMMAKLGFGSVDDAVDNAAIDNRQSDKIYNRLRN
jgi:hypothetical protein